MIQEGSLASSAESLQTMILIVRRVRRNGVSKMQERNGMEREITFASEFGEEVRAFVNTQLYQQLYQGTLI